MKITKEKFMKSIEKAKIEGISPNTLLISKPFKNKITIGDHEFFVNMRPLITTYLGIEIWIDEKLPKGKAYLFDRYSGVEVLR